MGDSDIRAEIRDLRREVACLREAVEQGRRQGVPAFPVGGGFSSPGAGRPMLAVAPGERVAITSRRDG